MNAPIRVVCEGCLRSVELVLEAMPEAEVACPFCGRRMDGPSSEAQTRVRPGGPIPDSKDSPETIDWAAAWTHGTLGTLGRFQLRERLGDGGFGQVYLAYDPRLDRDVALKVLKQPEPSDRVMERFFREARAVARLDHPNIVPVHDAGFDDGRCWVAYQLVSGRPLWWYRDRQRMDASTVARIVRELAGAVSRAHGMGVVHRDIKPGNVMIDDSGRPRLIDFGLARRSDLESDLTREGVVVGTPVYMSPEQAIGQSRQVDERSDVYSLGVIFYELLCGRRPQEILGENATPKPGAPRRPPILPDVRSIDRKVPRALAAICAKAMSPLPNDRYPSARVLAEAIDLWLDCRRATRHRFAMGMVAVAASVGLAIAAISVPRLTNRDAAPEKQQGTPGALAALPPTTQPAPAAVGADSPAPVAPAVDTRFIYSRNSNKYHRPSCSFANDIEPRNREEVPSAEAARAKGLIPCSKCTPPDPRAKASVIEGLPLGSDAR